MIQPGPRSGPRFPVITEEALQNAPTQKPSNLIQVKVILPKTPHFSQIVIYNANCNCSPNTCNRYHNLGDACTSYTEEEHHAGDIWVNEDLIWKGSDCKAENTKGYKCWNARVCEKLSGKACECWENYPCWEKGWEKDGKGFLRTNTIDIRRAEISEEVISMTKNTKTVKVRALGWHPKLGVIRETTGIPFRDKVRYEETPKAQLIDCIFEYEETRLL
jgi:hypothetical protein